MPPIGLDYKDTPAGLLGLQDIENQRANAIASAQKQALFEEEMKNKLLQGLYARELAPLDFFQKRAEHVQGFTPIDINRLSQLANRKQTEAATGAAQKSISDLTTPPPKIDLGPEYAPEEKQGKSAGEIGTDVKEGIDAAKGRKPNVAIKQFSPEQMEAMNQASQISNENLSDPDIYFYPPAGVSTGEGQDIIKEEIRQRQMRQLRMPQSEEQTPADSRGIYQQQRSPYGMDTLSLAQYANSIDPAQYIGKQEMDLAQKIIGSEAAQQIAALKAQQGAAQTKTKLEYEYEQRIGALKVELQKTKVPSERAMIEAKIKAETERFRAIMGYRSMTERPRAAGGGDDKERLKAIDLKNRLIAMKDKMTSKEKRKSNFLNTYNSFSKYPDIQAEFYRAYKEEIDEKRMELQYEEKAKGRKPQGAAVDTSSIKTNIINYMSKAAKAGPVPATTWNGIAGAAIEAGLPKEDLDALKKIFQNNIEESVSDGAEPIRLR